VTCRAGPWLEFAEDCGNSSFCGGVRFRDSIEKSVFGQMFFSQNIPENHLYNPFINLITFLNPLVVGARAIR
jgi:hypothetical protein